MIPHKNQVKSLIVHVLFYMHTLPVIKKVLPVAHKITQCLTILLLSHSAQNLSMASQKI